MKKTFFIWFLLTCPFFLNGQVNKSFHVFRERHDITIDALRKISYPLAKQKEHNLYLDKNWQSSCVLTKDSTYLYFNGRYNVLSQAPEAFLNGQVRSLRPTQVELLSIGNQFFMPIKRNNAWQYLELLSEGEISLLKRFKLREMTVPGFDLVPKVTGEKKMIVESELLFSRDFVTFKKIKPNKNKIISLFNDESDSIVDFIEEKNIKFKEERSLVRLFNYYNSL